MWKLAEMCHRGDSETRCHLAYGHHECGKGAFGRVLGPCDRSVSHLAVTRIDVNEITFDNFFSHFVSLFGHTSAADNQRLQLQSPIDFDRHREVAKGK